MFKKMENFAANTAFRGFEKIPVVIVARTDITPYLKITKTLPWDSSMLLNKYGITFKECSVKVVRDDLIKLKNNFNMNSNDFVACRICKKSYPDIKKLRNHQEKKHMIVLEPKVKKRVSFSDYVIVHELKEYHKCRKCVKIFEHYRSLKLHMKKDHKKRKCYICNYCTKSFVDRCIFKIHIKLHCDVCAKIFPNRAEYIDHRKYFCKVFKTYKCKTCMDSFFKFMDLKDHSYDHFNSCFVCDMCKEQLQSKCAVSHHIAFLHSSNRPTTLYECRNLGNEQLFLCNFCDETSVEKYDIEKHVELLPDLFNKAMKGYKDYYFCDQCLCKFDIEQEMLQHKWTHFLQNNNMKTESPEEKQNVDEKSVKASMKINKTYQVTDKIPEYMLPNVVLEKLPVDKIINLENISNDKNSTASTAADNFVDVNNLVGEEKTNLVALYINKPIIDSKSKKTILSKHQCEQCNKYFSSNYCLKRHMATLHPDLDNLQCQVCEEIFVWPSLLQSHNCIRNHNIPEMPFDDARPEIHFDNIDMLSMLNHDHELNDLSGIDNDYMDYVDFEIPAPIVELTEYEGTYVPNSGQSVDKGAGTATFFSAPPYLHSNPNSNFRGNMPNGSNKAVGDKVSVDKNVYKLVMQEIPIEF